MFQEITIRNFMLFKSIAFIPRRINLITGRNSMGKTALLEAIRIIAATGHPSVINHILKRRGLYSPSDYSIYRHLCNYSSKLESTGLNIKLNHLEIDWDENNIEKNRVYSHRKDFQVFYKLDPTVSPDFPQDKAVILPFQSDLEDYRKYWDQITLTPKEAVVRSILKDTIVPDLEGLDFTKSGVKVLIGHEAQPRPISTLGDGAQRVLGLAIALVSAENSVLLIDEVESGIHYSLQRKLWEVIFQYATKLNVQVFATTHSNDTLSALVHVASHSEDPNLAQFVRLQRNANAQIDVVTYAMDDLEHAAISNIEMR